MTVNNSEEKAKILLRVGISLVFIWFGISQLINPEYFFGYIPQWLTPHSFNMTHIHSLSFMHSIPSPQLRTLILFNGLFELTLGLFLFFKFYIRVSALLLSIHLVGIIISLGYNDLAVRDFSILVSLIAIYLFHPKEEQFNKK